jgi:citrate synthase
MVGWSVRATETEPIVGISARNPITIPEESRMDRAVLSLGDKDIELPVVVGTEGEHAVDISKLRAQTGYITLDNGYVNTGCCESKITFIDGEAGILRYRGYSIEDVCANLDFLETAYLVIYGELPSKADYTRFVSRIRENQTVEDGIFSLLKTFPESAHPMSMLMSAAAMLSAYNPYDTDSAEETELAIIKFIAKMPTICAAAYRVKNGLEPILPDEGRSYSENFLYMMFDGTEHQDTITVENAKALDVLLTLHVDHEQNCSAATVRIAGSSQVNLFASVGAGIASLWGPLHGGANQAVIEMLQEILADGGDIDKYIDKAKDKQDGFRLMGFGHRVYKNMDPRATLIKGYCDQVLGRRKVKDPLLDLAKTLEEAALADSYFVDRKLFPNVDFYSGIIYKALGIPSDMFTVMFALGRLPGWIAQWRELKADPKLRIGRPRQVYQGHTLRSITSMEKRG